MSKIGDLVDTGDLRPDSVYILKPFSAICNMMCHRNLLNRISSLIDLKYFW